MQEKFARLFMSIAAILGAITVLTLSAESRPHWRGLLLAGLAKLHSAFLGEGGGAIQAPQEISFASSF